MSCKKLIRDNKSANFLSTVASPSGCRPFHLITHGTKPQWQNSETYHVMVYFKFEFFFAHFCEHCQNIDIVHLHRCDCVREPVAWEVSSCWLRTGSVLQPARWQSTGSRRATTSCWGIWCYSAFSSRYGIVLLCVLSTFVLNHLSFDSEI